jgi:hypothetical protein
VEWPGQQASGLYGKGRGRGPSHVVKGETTIVPGPGVVLEAHAAVVSLPSKAHRHPTSDGDREPGAYELTALAVRTAPLAGQEFCKLFGSS